MGISSALYTGVSGLNTNGQAMTVIGNNLANTNTVAYKGSRTIFSDLLSSTISGSGGSSQVGRGVGISKVDNVFSQGTFESTSSGLDLAIEGDSFFLLSPSAEQTVYYSRAGSFSFDKSGYLVNPEGMRVQGMAYGDDNKLAGGDPSDIFLDSSGLIKGAATSGLTLTTNLDSNSNVLPDHLVTDNPLSYNYTESTTVDSVTAGNTINIQTYYRKTEDNTWQASYTATETDIDGKVLNQLTEPTTPVDVILDATGKKLVDKTGGTDFAIAAAGDTITWDKPAAGGAAPTTVVGATAAAPSAEIATSLAENKSLMKFDYKDPKTYTYSASTQVFDSLGNPHLVSTYFRKSDENTWDVYYSANKEDGTTIPLDPNADRITQLSFGPEGQPVDGAGESLLEPKTALTEALDWNNGSKPTPATLTFATTQFNSDSIVISQEQNGYGAGNLSAVNIDKNGTVVASYSNGKKRNIAAISLAKFKNPQGLEMQGNNLFASSNNSGYPRVGLPGPELGNVFTNSLEQSNVDISAEFVKMITIQRGFQANSKIITTVDSLLGELINLKR